MLVRLGGFLRVTPESDRAPQRVLCDPHVGGSSGDRIVEIAAPIEMSWRSPPRNGAHSKQGIGADEVVHHARVRAYL